jgi:hypothetical protein
MEANQVMQRNLHKSEARLQHVEEASKFFGETQKKMDDKIDGLVKMMQQWNALSDMSSTERTPQPFTTSQSPQPHQTTQTMLTPDELAVGGHKIHIFTTNIPTFHSRYRR